MRKALVVACFTAALTGCGDNAPECGHVEVLTANRNIWGGHIAVDGERVYFSDYDNGVGTHLVFRQPREGGQPLVIAARGEDSRFGFGMALDEVAIYWAAEVPPLGYSLLATPLLGGQSQDLTGIGDCTAVGIAVDASNTYAGSIRCNNGVDDLPARVVVAPHDASPGREIWTSTTADVSDLAARDGVVYVATSAGLVRVSDTATDVLDGRATYHVVIANDELVYSTEEAIFALPLAGGTARTLYTFHTSLENPRAFAVDGTDLYIAEPPEMLFLPAGGEPVPIVRDMGGAITHITARDGHAYWATLALPGSLGVPGTYSGAVLRVARPCL